MCDGLFSPLEYVLSVFCMCQQNRYWFWWHYFIKILTFSTVWYVVYHTFEADHSADEDKQRLESTISLYLFGLSYCKMSLLMVSVSALYPFCVCRWKQDLFKYLFSLFCPAGFCSCCVEAMDDCFRTFLRGYHLY